MQPKVVGIEKEMKQEASLLAVEVVVQKKEHAEVVLVSPEAKAFEDLENAEKVL